MRLKAPGFLGEEGGAPIRIGRLFLSRIDSPSAAPSRGFDSGFVLADPSLFSFGSLADIPPGTKARLNTNNAATSERTQNLGFNFIRPPKEINQTLVITTTREYRTGRYSNGGTARRIQRVEPGSSLRPLVPINLGWKMYSGHRRLSRKGNAQMPPCKRLLRYDSSMPTSLAYLIFGMVMLLFAPVIGSGRPLVCLPDGIKPDTIITSEQSRSAGTRTIRRNVTVSQLLTKLRTRCKKGKLVDGKSREI